MRDTLVGRLRLACLVVVLTCASGLVLARGISDVVGTLISIDVHNRQIVVREKLLKGEGKDITLTVAPKAAILIEKRRSGLEDLKAGDTVAVSFSQGSGGAVADFIEKKVEKSQRP